MHKDNRVLWVIRKDTKEKQLIWYEKFDKTYHKEIKGEKPFLHPDRREQGEVQKITINSIQEIAEKVEKEKAQSVPTEAPEVVGEKEDTVPELPSEEEMEGMKMSDLRVLAKARGVKIPFGKKKVEIVKMLLQ